MKKSDQRILISGAALQSTVDTMSVLGNIGQAVLSKYGIDTIDKEAKYSYSIRSEIHREVLSRYGSIALEVIGFRQGETIFVLTETEKLYQKLEKQFKSDNERERFEALEKLNVSWIEEADKLTKELNKFNSYDFGIRWQKISNNSFKIYSYSTWAEFQSSFLYGVLDYVLCRFFSKYWKYKMIVNTEETKIDANGFCTFSFTFQYELSENPLSIDVILSNYKQEMKDLLLKKVLDESENKNAELELQKKQIELISHQIGKYIPPQIHDALFAGEYDTEITTRRKKLTIFFSDIKNFTATSEGLQPEDLTKYLNEYFSEMTTIALNSGATIDKYIGDAMMVFFGDPESKGEKEDARACVGMALSMQERMGELQEKWRNEGFADPFQVRMGINTGYCNVGNFGSDQRLTYTIIGGEVNVAQRLEANADAGGILLSYEAYAHAQDMIEVEEKETITMKGINREIKVFAVIDRKRKINNKKAVEKKKPTKKELSEIDQIQQDSKEFKQEMRQELTEIKSQLKKLLNK